MNWYEWKPYVPVAERKRQAKQEMDKLRKKGVDIQPVEITGRKIAKTFWGEAWCDHLESYSDYANRLPRGRTYVRNGSVCHLAIGQGKIEAKVSGSEFYEVSVRIKKLSDKKWKDVKKKCGGQIGSLLELLKGDLSGEVMEIVTDRKTGLFPSPREISFECDCPDWAGMCKHIAAVLYGIGARFDEQPKMLFHLRGVDHNELIESDAEIATSGGQGKKISTEDLSDVFGIDLQTEAPKKKTTTKRKTSTVKKKTAKKKTAKKATTTVKKTTPAKKTARKVKAKSTASEIVGKKTPDKRKKSPKK